MITVDPIRKSQVKNVVKTSLLKKLKTYEPESSYMPFHYRLLGKDRMALYSFIQSLNTTFGASIFEPAAKELAKDRFKVVKSQVKPYPFISSSAHVKIQEIIDELSYTGKLPDKVHETEELRSVSLLGTMGKVKLTNIDIWLESYDNHIYMIDMKTVKPNIGQFKEFKRTLLEWVAAELADNPSAKIDSLIGIPYNPYEPKPYNRWTMRGMLDLDHELLVAEELWEFIGGVGAYQILLDCFEEVGIEMHEEIDNHFAKYK